MEMAPIPVPIAAQVKLYRFSRRGESATSGKIAPYCCCTWVSYVHHLTPSQVPKIPFHTPTNAMPIVHFPHTRQTWRNRLRNSAKLNDGRTISSAPSTGQDRLYKDTRPSH